jgi:hypothetical protein
MGLLQPPCDIPARLGKGAINGHANVRGFALHHCGRGVRHHDGHAALFVDSALRTICIFDTHQHSLYSSTEAPQGKAEAALDVCAQNVGDVKTLSTNLNLHMTP